MPKDMTDGGLIIAPQIDFMDPAEMDGYEAPIEPELIRRGGYYDEDEYTDGDPGYNPIQDYSDEFLKHPCDIAMYFIDPNKSIGNVKRNERVTLPNGSMGYKNVDTPTYMGNPTNILINMDGMEKEEEEEEETDNKVHKVDLGYADPGRGSSVFKPCGRCTLTNKQTNALFTDLAIKASEKISSGEVNKKDIEDIIDRSMGVYEGDEYKKFEFNMTPTTRDEHTSTASLLKRTNLSSKIVSYLEGFKDEEFEGKHLTMYDIGEQFMGAEDHYIEKNITGSAIMTGIVHGIGAKDFLHEFLDSFSKLGDVEKQQVDKFLGDGVKQDNNLVRHISRALPISSPYHGQLIRNHYKNSC